MGGQVEVTLGDLCSGGSKISSSAARAVSEVCMHTSHILSVTSLDVARLSRLCDSTGPPRHTRMGAGRPTPNFHCRGRR